MKKSKKILAVLLTVLTVVGIFSCATTVWAEEYNEYVETKEYEEKLLTETVALESEKAEIVCEVEEKREEYSKTYKRADGSYTTVVSQTPIHTLKDGEWKEIDNSLKTEGEILKNTDGSFDIEFPETISENEKITVTNNGESIAFSVNNIDNSSAVVTTPEVDGKDIIEEDLSKTVSEITYESVDKNTDVQYVISSGFVKENIIVNDKAGLKDTYSFDIEKGNLVAVLDDSNNLSFKNEKKEIVFTIPAPVMTDANNAVSYDIDVEVENADKSVLTLTYTPSKEWLNSNDRAYPVVIDPVIVLPDVDDTLIEDTVILGGTGDAEVENTNFSNSVEGYIINTQEARGEVLVKINLDTFSFCKDPNVEVTDFNYLGTGYAVGGNVLAKPINGTWNSKTITYDDVYPSDGSTPVITYEDEIVDYFTGVSQNDSTSGVTLYFNITELFKEWIRGERANNGFALIAENEQTTGAFFLAGDHTPASKTYTFNTFCSIDYIDTSANNEAYEYLTQEIGRAGTASINTFTRGFSLTRSDLALFGNIMPVNINFSYNGSFNNLIELYVSMLELAGEEGLPEFPYGNNWLPSYLQTIFQVSEYQYQVFVGDGTIAVFNCEEETSDGITVTTFTEDDTSTAIGYELEIIDQSASESYENLKLISPSGETTYFNEEGFIREIYEGTANPDGSYDKMTVECDSDNLLKIDHITDGAGRKYDFVYDEELGLLTEINCLAADGTQIKAGSTDEDLKILYNYDEDRNLIDVTYPDGKYVMYDYENGNLVKATNVDDYNIEYTYDSLDKVTMITEMAGSTLGNSITLEELSNRQVKIIDAYLGTEIHQFGKDGKLNYILDDKGNYYKSENSQSSDESVSVEYGWKVEPENLLKNGSFEDVTNSKPGNWTNAFNAKDTINDDAIINKVCEVNGTTQQTQTVSVNGGTAYTFSVYAKTTSDTGVLDIQVSAKDSNGSSSTKAEVLNLNKEFEQYSVTVENLTDITEVTVTIGGQNTTGEVWVDNAQLERGKGTAEFNYIENGTFQYVTDNAPDNWSEATVVTQTLNEESVNAVVLNGGLPYYEQSEGIYTLKDSVSSVTQNIKINGKKGDIYSVGGWFKGLFDDNYINPNFMPSYATTNTQLTNSLAQIKVTYRYTKDTKDSDGNDTQETVTENFVVDFEAHNDSWQYAVDSFALKADVESVDVTIITKNIPETSYATNISLTKDSDSVLIEDDTTTEEDSTDTSCPDDCQCAECLRKETTTEDAFGNILSNKSTDGIKYIETLSSYTTDGNYLATYTDERGNETTYDYNTLNGILESVTSPMGIGSETTTTSYEYDEMGNVVSVSTGLNDDESQTLEYVYENDRLTEITTPNGKFRIIYDDWGQVLSVNVVVIKNNRETNIPLVQYTYGAEAKRTQIASVTYTNSSKNKSVYRYYYTDDGNVENITLNQKDKHTIAYDNLGALTQIKNDDGRTVKYTDNGVNIYNAQDVLVYTSITGDDGLTTEENYGIKYKEHESKYEYDSATGSSTNTTALDIAKYYRVEQAATTDWFGREDSHLTTIYDITEETETVSAETIGKISTEYEYPVADDGKTSSNVEKYINKTYNGKNSSVRVYDGYYYEYDKQNKISAEKTLNADGTTIDKYSYEYDEFGQLVRFNDAVENKTYTYTYDNNGNILTKSEYAYTTGDLGTATNTTTYGYDTQWKDKLTTVGDKTIAYDNIGNPTTYLGATLTWEGRNLKLYETEEQKLQYEYDENGMRYRTTITNKEDNSVGYLDYVWVDSKLISISFTSDELNQTVKYLYNDFDEPVGFVSTREDGSVDTYYYLKNAQGDITNIVSAAGKKMVSFTYDVFGKRTVEYQANGSTNPGQIELLTQMKADLLNPFAYRGYCYDYDMGMYYLQSRYYDPNTGRFINADDTNYLNATGTVLGCNLFAYCENDPVNFVDPRGTVSFSDVTDVLSSILTIIKNKVSQFLKENVGVWKSGSFLYIKTTTLAKVIDAVILVGNAIKSAIKATAIKGVCSALIKYFKDHPEKFTKYLKEKGYNFIASNLPSVANASFAMFAKILGKKIVKNITVDYVKDKIFNRFSVYRWINTLTSPGTILANIFDMVDSSGWNGQIKIKIK